MKRHGDRLCARAPCGSFGGVATLLPWNRADHDGSAVGDPALYPATACAAECPAGGHCNPKISASNKGDPGLDTRKQTLYLRPDPRLRLSGAAIGHRVFHCGATSWSPAVSLPRGTRRNPVCASVLETTQRTEPRFQRDVGLVAPEDLFAAQRATRCDDLELIGLKNRFSCHVGRVCEVLPKLVTSCTITWLAAPGSWRPASRNLWRTCVQGPPAQAAP